MLIGGTNFDCMFNLSTYQGQILIQKSGLVEWYNAALCTLTLDLPFGSRYAPAAFPSVRNGVSD
jgi:hypothetical protein